MNRLILLLFFTLIGGAGGYGIAWYQFHPRAAHNNEPAVTMRTGDVQRPAGPVVPVRFYDRTGQPLRDVTGILLAGPDLTNALLLLPLTAFHEADRAEIVTGGRPYPLDSVVALDEDAGLLLLATDLPATSALTPVDDVSLYLGRDVRALAPDEKTHGIVDSPAQRFAGRFYSYAVKLDVPFSTGFAALQDAQSGELIGVILNRDDKSDRYLAIDTEPVNALIASVGATAAQSVAQFSQKTFLETVHGRLYRIQLAVARADWNTVAALSRQLRRDDLTGRDNIALQLHYAFLQMAGAGLETGNYDQALSILNEADRLLDPDPARIRMRAKILTERGDPLQGIAELSRGIDQGIADSATYNMLQSLVLDQVDNSRLTAAATIDMLNQAIMRDAEFAPYHDRLGRLLYKQNRYAEALTSFNYAAQLDPALQSELQPLMDSARQRLSTPGQIIVPLQARGNSYIVDVSVNNVPQRFVLDTGAGVTVLSSSVANSIGLFLDDAEYVMLNTANGVVRAPLVTVDSVQLGGAVVNNLKVAVLDRMGPVDGLLGLDFLNHFDIDINQNTGEMALRRR